MRALLRWLAEGMASLAQLDAHTAGWIVGSAAGLLLVMLTAAALLFIALAVVRRVHRGAGTLLALAACAELVASLVAPALGWNEAVAFAARFGVEGSILHFSGPACAAVAVVALSLAFANVATLLVGVALCRPRSTLPRGAG